MREKQVRLTKPEDKTGQFHQLCILAVEAGPSSPLPSLQIILNCTCIIPSKVKELVGSIPLANPKSYVGTSESPWLLVHI